MINCIHIKKVILLASYINFFMGKDYIILPKFNVEEDKVAYDVINNFYNDKEKFTKLNLEKYS